MFAVVVRAVSGFCPGGVAVAISGSRSMTVVTVAVMSVVVSLCGWRAGAAAVMGPVAVKIHYYYYLDDLVLAVRNLI